MAVASGCGSKPADTTLAQSAIAPRGPLPGMPPVLDPLDIYAADHPNLLDPAVAKFPSYIYVPNSGSNTADIIDPKTFKIVKNYRVGRQPQHVVPSWDLKTLWVLNDLGASVTRINPANAQQGGTILVDDPYNIFFAPGSQY